MSVRGVETAIGVGSLGRMDPRTMVRVHFNYVLQVKEIRDDRSRCIPQYILVLSPGKRNVGRKVLVDNVV